MRQLPEGPRPAVGWGTRHAGVLGPAWRMRHLFRRPINDDDIPNIAPRACGFQCFRFAPSPPLPLGVRRSTRVDPNPSAPQWEAMPDDEAQATVPSTLSDGQEFIERVITRLPEPSRLLAESTRTARVLDVLAGDAAREEAGPAEVVVAEEFAESTGLDADCSDAVLGPRPSLGLETSHNVASDRPWNWAGEDADAAPSATTVHQERQPLPDERPPEGSRTDAMDPAQDTDRTDGSATRVKPDKRPVGVISKSRDSAIKWAGLGLSQLGRLRGGELKGDSLRRRRQEIMSATLAGNRNMPPMSHAVKEERATTMPEINRIQWKPGDPFGGRSSRRRNQFRWHAMLLTASGVAGAGYAALRLLILANVIPG